MCDECKELEKKLRQKDKAITKKHKNILELTKMMEIIRNRSEQRAERYISKYIHSERLLYDVREVMNNDQAKQIQELEDRRQAMKEIMKMTVEHMELGSYHGWNCTVLGILKNAEESMGREPGWGLRKYHREKSCGSWCQSREQLTKGE